MLERAVAVAGVVRLWLRPAPAQARRSAGAPARRGRFRTAGAATWPGPGHGGCRPSCGSSLRAGWRRSRIAVERPQGEVLGEREQRPAGDRRQRDQRREVRVDGAERRRRSGCAARARRDTSRRRASPPFRAARRRRSGCRRPACRAAARPPTPPPRPRRRRRPSASACGRCIGLKTCNCNGRRRNGYALCAMDHEAAAPARSRARGQPDRLLAGPRGAATVLPHLLPA